MEHGDEVVEIALVDVSSLSVGDATTRLPPASDLLDGGINGIGNGIWNGAWNLGTMSYGASRTSASNVCVLM